MSNLMSFNVADLYNLATARPNNIEFNSENFLCGLATNMDAFKVPNIFTTIKVIAITLFNIVLIYTATNFHTTNY